jgi:hypothetical protein
MNHLASRPLALLLTALFASLAGCAPASGPPRGPTKAPATGTEPSAAPAPIAAFDGNAIQRAFRLEKLETFITKTDQDQVRAISFGGRGSPLPPLEHVRTWLAAHGSLLGYGALGPMEAEPQAAERPKDLPSQVVRFPRAAACPGLTLEIWYAEDEGLYEPYVWHFTCGSSTAERQSLEAYRSMAQEKRAKLTGARLARKLDDRIADWARSEGLSPTEVRRRPDGVRVRMRRPGSNAANGANRRADTEALAARAAQLEGLPALDTTEVTTPDPPIASDSGLLATRFLRLERRLARPPLDGACIDPRVRIELGEESAPSTQKEAAYFIAEVSVTCAKEPTGGRRAPPHAAPKSAASSPRFLAICAGVNYGVDATFAGTVVDNRGDVYTFRGGPPFSGTSARELAVLLRHEKAYVGTLPADAVDRLVALTPTVAREPFKAVEQDVEYDAPATGCSLLARGATPDALVTVDFSHSSADQQGRRRGPASRAAEAILTSADRLANRGRQPPPPW